jgi:uncharacterized protein YqgC (DUF456 family)
MWEAIHSWAGWGGVGTGLAWVVTGSLLLAGLVGCFFPVLPGHLILLMAAVAHRVMLGREGSGIAWWSFLVLILLLAISQAFEFFSGAAGARWFGGTRWGAAGAFVGGIVGMFFLPFGLLIGPLAGALVGEILFAEQEFKPAAVSGVGSVVGTLAALVVKVVIGVLMVAWFFIDVWFIR